MPRYNRLSLREKRFAQLWVLGHFPSEAYRRAGFPPDTSHAYRKLKEPRIQAYIAQLQDRNMRRFDITADKIINDLQQALEIAKTDRSPMAMVNAAMAQAKLVGLVVERIESKQISQMSREELVETVRQVYGQQADMVLRVLGLEPAPALAKPEEAVEAEWHDLPTPGSVN